MTLPVAYQHYILRDLSVDSEELFVPTEKIAACVSDVLDVGEEGESVLCVRCNLRPVIACYSRTDDLVAEPWRVRVGELAYGRTRTRHDLLQRYAEGCSLSPQGELGIGVTIVPACWVGNLGDEPRIRAQRVGCDPVCRIGNGCEAGSIVAVYDASDSRTRTRATPVELAYFLDKSSRVGKREWSLKSVGDARNQVVGIVERNGIIAC